MSGNRIELVLYVSGDSVPSQRATTTMERLVEEYGSDQIDLRVRDVTIDPTLAADDGIIVTPTLLKSSPLPRMWVLGDLSRQGRGHRASRLLRPRS